MADRGGQLDVRHAFAADFRAGDGDATLIADHTAEAHTLVLTTVTFPVTGRTEDFFAEQTITLGFECAVVDGFGFGNLTM
jgi:hypothetical protein